MPRIFSELKSGGTIPMLSPPALKSGGKRPPRPPPIDARDYGHFVTASNAPVFHCNNNYNFVQWADPVTSVIYAALVHA